jgi:hypothetical protein
MTDTSVTNIPPAPTPPPLPNDAAARSLTGEILEPSQIKPAEPKTPPSGDPPSSTTPEPKPGEKPEDKPPTQGAPETYAQFKLPDGLTLDSKQTEAATAIFKELNLTQDAAQRLVDFHAQQLIDAAKAPENTYTQTREKWVSEVKADAEIRGAVSGDKTGLDAVKLDIGRALNSLGDPKLVANFREAMDVTGAGDNPAFIKAFWKLSQHVTEGKHVTGSNPSPHGQRAPGATDRPEAAKALYPNLP